VNQVLRRRAKQTRQRVRLLLFIRNLGTSPSNASSAIKRDTMITSVPKSRRKTQKGRFKYAKWMILVSKKWGKRNLSVRFVSGILISMRKDPFMRYWIILSNLGQVRICAHNEGHLAKIFVDTGANCNTISGKFYLTLVYRPRFEVCANFRPL